jgi:outer membrane protein assembly factor BamD
MKIQKLTSSALLYCLLLVFSGTALAQASITSDQSAKAIFARAGTEIKNSHFVEARQLLEILINRHPNSRYVPLAKLRIADSFFAEGAFDRAEMEYRDFIAFFPKRPEVAEARTKISSIQKRSMI